MQFALILSGDNAPTPAPRIEAIPSVSGIGLWDESTQEIWQVKPDDIKAALPSRYRRLHLSGIWFDKAARVDLAGQLKGSAPYASLRNARYKQVLTVYLLPVTDSPLPVELKG